MRSSQVATLLTHALALLLAAGHPTHCHAHPPRNGVFRREGRSLPDSSPHVSVNVLTDLRKFFEDLVELQDELDALDQEDGGEEEEEEEQMYEALRALADHRKTNQMRFVPPATLRKIKLNPSLLRSGLGRK